MLTDLLSRLDRQIVRDIFSFASATLDTRTLLRRATRDLKPYPRNTIRDADATDHEASDDEVPLPNRPNHFANVVRSFVPQNAERFDALLATVGMASLRGVSTAFRDPVDEMAAREHLAEFGVYHVETTVPADPVEDYTQLKIDPQTRHAIRLRRGAPWAALADRVRAAAALMTAMLAYDPRSFHDLSSLSWQQQQKNALVKAFMKTGWTTPWVIDAHRIVICNYASRTDDPRCVALRAFAVSLAPPSSAGEIGDLPLGGTNYAELFHTRCRWSYLIPGDNSRGSDPPHFLTSFCAFTFRPNDDDFRKWGVDDEDIRPKSETIINPEFAKWRGGYAVRVADLREPEGGSVESVRRWDQFWAEEEDSDRDYDDDFDSASSHVDYASFENPFADRLPPIVLDTVQFDMQRAEVHLDFRFADCSTCKNYSLPHGLYVSGRIRPQTGGLCFSRPDSDDA